MQAARPHPGDLTEQLLGTLFKVQCNRHIEGEGTLKACFLDGLISGYKSLIHPNCFDNQLRQKCPAFIGSFALNGKFFNKVNSRFQVKTANSWAKRLLDLS